MATSPLDAGKQLSMKVYFSRLLAALLFSACTPTVQVNTPSEPITINMNVKIDHEVRVKVDRELDEVISKDSGLF